MTGVYRMIVNATVHPSLLLAAALVIGGAAPARAEGPGTGEVTAVSLAPAAGKAELVIAVKGAVDVRDFMLTSPDRLVLDVVGARGQETWTRTMAQPRRVISSVISPAKSGSRLRARLTRQARRTLVRRCIPRA